MRCHGLSRSGGSRHGSGLQLIEIEERFRHCLQCECLVSSPDSSNAYPGARLWIVRPRPSRWNMGQGVAAVGPSGRLAAVVGRHPTARIRPSSAFATQTPTGCPDGACRACKLSLEDCVFRCDTLSIGPESRRRFVCCTVHGIFRPVTELPCDKFYDNTAPASSFGPTAGPNRRHAPILPASAATGPVPPAMESASGWQLPVLPDDEDDGEEIACHCYWLRNQGPRPSPFAQGKPSLSSHADESALGR